jgi:ankyrin repeat protein
LNGQADCVKQLISYKADIEILNNKKQTPLLLAVTQFNVPIIEQFVESGANLNAGDQDGDTCLHLLLNERIANKDTTNLANQQSLLESSLLESKNISKV